MKTPTGKKSRIKETYSEEQPEEVEDNSIGFDRFIAELNGKKIFIGQNVSPKQYDIAFASCNSYGNPGELNRFVLNDLGYTLEAMPKFDQLKLGYAWREIDNLNPIIFIVTVGESIGVKSALNTNLYNALDEYKERIINKRLWMPLMGTGTGRLEYTDSLTEILRAIIKWDEMISWDFSCEFHFSFPNSIASEHLVEFEKLILGMISETSVLRNPRPPIKASDAVPIILDNPARNDQLGHRDFARSIARHIQQIWEGSENSKMGNQTTPPEANTGKENEPSAFILHIYGQWGSGKSTLLNFLKDEIQTASNPVSNNKWVIIEFNAWQHQHVDPPWWPLITAVFKQSNKQLWKNFKKKEKFRSIWIWIKEFFYRRFIGREHIPIALAVLFIVIFLILLIKPSFKWIFSSNPQTDGSELEKIIKIVTSIAALGSLFWAFFKKVGLSLVNASTSSAQSFLQFASDSMNIISSYFKRMVKAIKHPVAIFIDDLDRCKPEYVVRFLEGIQTLFRNNRILYIIAADKRWISVCFEKCYNEFSESIKKPGQRLGDLFVEKAFQLAIRVPKLSSSDKFEYLNYLLSVKKKGEKIQESQIQETQRKLDDVFMNEVTDDGIFEKYDAVLKDGIPKYLAKKMVLEKLSDRKVRESLEHALQQFSKYLDPNPRSIKRLLNFYAIYREIIFIEEKPIDRSKLVRWLILSMRWPVLAEYLVENPGHIELIGQKPSKKHKDLELPKEIQLLFNDKHVQDLVMGDVEKEERLNTDTIIQYADLF